MCKTVSKQISISGWNINGMYRRNNGANLYKMDDDSLNGVMKSDIVFLSETHLSYKDTLSHDGYESFLNCRSNESRKRRGGLAVFIKRSILTGITLVDKSLSELMWFKMNSKFFGFEKDLFICFLYITPSNSTYVKKSGLDKQIFSKLDDNIVKYSNQGEIMLMGDLNAHINCNEQDFIRNDSDSILDSFLPKNDIADSVQIFRNTQVNQTTNSYVKSIIELCNNSQLRILNGRTIGDSVGKATYFNFNGVTINDYCICSASFMKRVVNFQVGSLYPLISDHCPITVNIFSKYKHSTPQEILRPKPFNLKWTKIVEEQFISNLNNIDLNSISDKIVSFKQKSLDCSISVDDQSEDLNNIVENFSGILKNAALCTKFKPKNN
jgi:exonuclease III